MLLPNDYIDAPLHRIDDAELPGGTGVPAMIARRPVRLELVYNPASGSFSQKRMDALVAALIQHGFAPRLALTTADGVSIPEDAELVCVHGGDGTVRLAVEALGERVDEVALAVCPAGTINLVARELGYSHEPEAFAAQLAEAWARAGLLVALTVGRLRASAGGGLPQHRAGQRGGG